MYEEKEISIYINDSIKHYKVNIYLVLERGTTVPQMRT